MADQQLVEAVERQVRAYNAHDIDTFVACYAADVVVEDANGSEVTRGREAIRADYAPFFAANPELHAEVRSRFHVGRYVVDEELVTGLADGDLHAIAIYRLDEAGLIDRVRFLS